VSPPSDNTVIGWCRWNPCDRKISYRRRFGLVAKVCTNPKRLLEGVLWSEAPPVGVVSGWVSSAILRE
jgi:hypothetical protein